MRATQAAEVTGFELAVRTACLRSELAYDESRHADRALRLTVAGARLALEGVGATIKPVCIVLQKGCGVGGDRVRRELREVLVFGEATVVASYVVVLRHRVLGVNLRTVWTLDRAAVETCGRPPVAATRHHYSKQAGAQQAAATWRANRVRQAAAWVLTPLAPVLQEWAERLKLTLKLADHPAVTAPVGTSSSTCGAATKCRSATISW